MMKVLRVATRSTVLALAQAEIVIAALKEISPDVRFEIVKITTRGDEDRSTALWEIKSTGFFTSKVEQALLAGEADLAVHSFKDLPVPQTKGLTIAAVCDRKFAEDCLIASAHLTSIDELAEGAKIGTSSLRRSVQIRNLRKDINIVPVRGSVTTRIRLPLEGTVDAVVVARAAMERLGAGDKISFCFKPEDFIPAAAQGALAVQTRSEDTVTTSLIAKINDWHAQISSVTERIVIQNLECGCRAPAGVFAQVVDEDVIIRAFLSDVEGESLIKCSIKGSIKSAPELAIKLANEILNSGGKEILDHL
ncbi:MAG: hydroxymethylbilane synthase [Sedimentisphaerales bacterium]|nr:hydroxymethylbilane synthase [Sedimentisphaerales bacterium]